MWSFKQKKKIPKVIVQYWNNTPPEEITFLMSSWKRFNPDYTHLIYNEKEAYNFILNEYGDNEANLFLSAVFPAMQSDIFRVAYILKNGGLYIDAATECILNLDSLVNNGQHATFMRKWHGRIWNGFILSAADNPCIKEIWERILHNLAKQESNDIWTVTGPSNFQLADNRDDVQVILQSEIKKYFNLVNDLEHKKNGHWSEGQKENSIFKST